MNAITDLQVTIDKIKEETNHYIPFYAYGDNEAACNMNERLNSIRNLCDYAETVLLSLNLTIV